MKVKSESEVAQSCLSLCDPWTAAHQVPPSMGEAHLFPHSGLGSALCPNARWS